ncbi:hypothetical protein BDR26DRAFT_859207 [Obelidium mucronatum]|nr:hypothetical protein BDR26DRAFT_859207 [Obelidium mucronatum]
MNPSRVFSIPELLDQIAVNLPPNEVYKMGQLNSRIRHHTQITVLKNRSSFAKANLSLFAASKTTWQMHRIATIPFDHLGIHYATAFLQLHGICESSLRILHKKKAWNLVYWADVMPDVFPSEMRDHVFRAVHHMMAKATISVIHTTTTTTTTTTTSTTSTTPSATPEETKPFQFNRLDDPVLILFWLCYFGSHEILSKLNVNSFLIDYEDDEDEKETILHNAFMFACDSGSRATAEWVLLSNLVDLETWGGQVLADAARLGNKGIVEMVLARCDGGGGGGGGAGDGTNDANVGDDGVDGGDNNNTGGLQMATLVGNGSLDLACCWAFENGHLDVILALVKAGVDVSKEYLGHVEPVVESSDVGVALGIVEGVLAASVEV